jgi:cytosine/adenosine deaminase-related metal-dependent hydrolase
MIIMPGMVDTHRHLWETALRGLAANWTLMQYLQNMLGPLAAAYRPEDVYVGNLLGSLEAINAGITTVFDWSHIMNSPEHTDQAIQGLHDAGIRAVFGYGTPGTGVWEWFYESQRTHPRDAERVQARYFPGRDGLLTLALAIRGPEYSTFPVSRQDIALARELQIPVSMHVGCGSFGPRYGPLPALPGGTAGAGFEFCPLQFPDCGGIYPAGRPRLLGFHHPGGRNANEHGISGYG